MGACVYVTVQGFLLDKSREGKSGFPKFFFWRGGGGGGLESAA